MPLQVGIDIDGVTANTPAAVCSWLSAHGHPTRLDDLVTYRLEDNPLIPGNVARECIQWFESAGVNDLDPLPGAVDAVESIARFASATFVTSRPIHLIDSTRRWIDKVNLGHIPIMFLSRHTKVKSSQIFDVIIDDDPLVVTLQAAEGRLAIEFQYPWSVATTNTPQANKIIPASNWLEALKVVYSVARDDSGPGNYSSTQQVD